MIRVAVLSYWHVHAEEYTQDVLDHPHTELVAIWDEIPERGEKMAARYAVPFITSLDELLARDDVDAVVVVTPTNLHRDVMVQAAKAGKHIFTEKVLAPTLREVKEVLDAVQQSEIKLTVSLPRLYEASTVAIREVVEGGSLGKLTQARVRLSHDGATAGWLPDHFFDSKACGGGAMIDLGCHPMYLVRLFLGLPERVTATYGYVTGRDVEDNAVALLAYEHGALGIVEAGFVNGGAPLAIELHGTEGNLFYGLPDETIRVQSGAGSAWTEVPIGDSKPRSFSQWVSHIEEGTAAEENVALAVDLTKLMEAANLSAAQGCSLKLSELKPRG